MSLKHDIFDTAEKRKMAKIKSENEEKNKHLVQLDVQFASWITEINSKILYFTSIGVSNTTCVNIFTVNMNKEQERLAIGLFQKIVDTFKAEDVVCKLETFLLEKESNIQVNTNIYRFCYYCKATLSWKIE
jgi:hypothetical protein